MSALVSEIVKYAESRSKIALQPDPPRILWHYTTSAGFEAIVRTGTIKLSNVRYCNDSKEFLHTIELVKIAAKRYAELHTETSAQIVISKLLEKIDSTDDSFVPMTFVFCLSEVADDLSQWRGYGGPGQGFAIGFDGSLLAASAVRKTQLFRCEYNTHRQIELLAEVVGALIMIFLEHGPKPPATEDEIIAAAALAVDHFLMCLGDFTVGLKHEAFAAEREWRLVAFNPPLKSLEFAGKQDSLSPILFANPEVKLPIVAFYAGPGQHNRASAVAGSLQLNRYEFVDVPPYVSTIPFRPMK
ncbi:DUF2971 domain-containing protein [Roseiterribacter gracilis]|uniref:DUF2971 domain-containing protein n=1 Tax=Roseiterribacter gracilis TaxID=2812848 RepID=A0A8S8X9Y6_9PROT|nr:hypothetical protein TMPK1_03840 [Rhodospirillales bacterium TMPK1]